MKNQFIRPLLIACVVGIICHSIYGHDYSKSQKKISTFEELISSLAKSPSKTPVEEFEESFDEKWKASKGGDFDLMFEDDSDEETTHSSVSSETPEPDEGYDDEFVSLIHPVSIYELITSLEAAPEDTLVDITPAETIIGNIRDEMPTHAGLINSGSDYLDEDYNNNYNVYFDIPKEVHIEVIPPRGTSYSEISPAAASSSEGTKRSFNPLQVFTKNLFGRPLKPKEFLKWSAKRLMKTIYPYYHKPRLRYPYYDEHGNGQLLYGYGTDELYKYDVFRPLQGYLR